MECEKCGSKDITEKLLGTKTGGLSGATLGENWKRTCIDCGNEWETYIPVVFSW